METISDKIIEKKRVVNGSIDVIWSKWTTREGLLSFFGSDNKIELEPGGSYEIYFFTDNPEGQRGGEGNKILSYLPNEMLSFTWNAPPQYDEVRNHEHKTWVVINFGPVGYIKTEVRIRHLGWLEGGQWDEVYEYFENAWKVGLDWLEVNCNAV